MAIIIKINCTEQKCTDTFVHELNVASALSIAWCKRLSPHMCVEKIDDINEVGKFLPNPKQSKYSANKDASGSQMFRIHLEPLQRYKNGYIKHTQALTTHCYL